jgi:hypothetical protein
MVEVHYHFSCSDWVEYDPENYISFFSAELVSEDNGNLEARVQVGEMNGYLVHLDFAREVGEDLHRVFDDYSCDLAKYFKILFDKHTNDFKKGLLDVYPNSGNVLIVHNLVIYPPHRGKHLGLQALVNVIKAFGLSCGVVVCDAFPLQYQASNTVEEFESRIGTKLLFRRKKSSIGRILQYLQGIGFRQIPHTRFCLIEPAIWRVEDYIRLCA